MQFNILDVSLTLALVLHAHQPVDNFDSVIEEAYRTSYEPFLAAAERHPGLRLTLHFSGWLLAWLRARHPDYIARLNHGLQAGRLEILGGGYYEPVLAAIPERDRRLQLERMRELVATTFGRQPRGAWLAERVWEPDLPATLAAAGFEYTVVDDTHLLMTGLEPEQTYGYFIAESGGAAIKLVPSNRFLRFAIPFQAEHESLEFLAAAARDQPGALLVMADDLEKFGTWPHTYEHVIAGGWLERFFERLDASSGWLSTATLGAALAASPALGLASPPTASYEEMMQWALPAAAGARLAAARADPATAPYRRFLAGAPWRNFFSKYPESNALHQYALELSERAAAAQDGEAQEEILAAECNDAYWHGLFGGLYAPHLRNAAYTHLLRAEARLPAHEARHGDLDRNGGEVAVLRNRQTRLVIEASDGGVVRELDWLPAAANVINSLARRPEAYHEQIRAQIATNPARLPGGAAAPGAELSALLQYDRYRRACHRLYLFPAEKTFADFLRLALAEDPVLAGGRFTLESLAAGSAVLAVPGNAARKRFALSAEGKLDCTFECPSAKPGLAAGVEMVFNLLAPQASDRAIVAGSERLRLDAETEVAGETLAFEDGWRRLRIVLRAPGARSWWLRPIHTVSQSESGYEKVYQGSVAMAVWRAAPALFQVSVEFLPLATP
ncbi:MAG TPA: alpha-amylase/4-alpha-glucanotransferase domain-containing protein [Terriglobales bacterium]|nr:alpha-amylase/4-alpha-glucanotransferase domain-containing protein [Terriglobales bacterium]